MAEACIHIVMAEAFIHIIVSEFIYYPLCCSRIPVCTWSIILRADQGVMSQPLHEYIP